MKPLHFRLRSILLLLALPAVVLIVFQAVLDRNAVLSNSKASARQIADTLAQKQQRIFSETERFLSELAQLPQVQNPSDPACSEFLAATLALSATYVNLGVPRADGVLICNALPISTPVNVADRPYFQRAQDARRFTVSAVQLDRAAAMPSMNFAYPVQPDGPEGDIAGVAVAVVSLAWWSQQLAAHDMPGGAIAFVVDEADQIAAHFPPEPVAGSILGQSIKALGLGAWDDRGDGNDTVTGQDGMQRLFHKVNLFQDGSGGGVMLGVGIPVDQDLAAANRAALRSFAILISSGAFLWLMVRYWTEQTVLRPLQDLQREVAGQAPPSTSDNIEEFRYLRAEFAKERGGRQAAERAERSRQERLEAVLDALPDLYFRLDQHHKIVEYRVHDPDELLVEPAAFLGKTMCEILPPDAARAFEENIRTHEQSKTVVTWDYCLKIKSKTEKQHFEARACPIRGDAGTVLVIRNITARRAAEEGMRLAAMVYESSSEGMIVADSGQDILTVNPALTQLSGRTPEALIGSNIHQIIPRSLRRKLRNGFRRANIREEGWSGELQIIGQDNLTIPVWMTLNAIFDPDGKPYRYVILLRDMTSQKKATETIWKQAHVDALTGLLNRAALGRHLEDLVVEAIANHRDLAVLFVDLDGLKQVNDRLGHAAGDIVLHQVARRLRGRLDPDMTIARYGGDEFVVLLKGGQVDKVESIVASVLTEIAQPFELEEDVVHLTASLGIARYPDDAVTADDLLSAADQAMYVAKAGGRNRATAFSASIRRAAIDKMNMVSELQKAVHGQKMDVYFQPIVDLQTGRVCKAEALLRWHHDQLGHVPPNRFIPLAEEAGLMGKLGEMVFARCQDALPKLRAVFGQAFQICINVSPIQLSQSTIKLEDWITRIETEGQRGDGFIIEITESALLGQQGPVADRLIALQDAGFQLALDDFGKGYSSLFYFLWHQIDYLKIDQEFVRSLPGNAKAETLCRSMVDMAHQLNVQVVAEGVETETQAAFLTRIGSDFGQGYLFDHPLPLADLLRVPTSFRD